MAFIDDGQRDGQKDENYLEILNALELEKNKDFEELTYEFDDDDENEVIDD